MLLRRVARPLLAASLVSTGASTLLDPDPAVAEAAPLIEKGAEVLPVQGGLDPAVVVQVDAAVKVVAGSMLALGWAPRFAAGALAVSLVPTTIVSHPFWRAQGAQRAAQRGEFVRSAGLLGGLLLAAADTEGRPSLGWRARRAARIANKAVRTAASSAGSTVEDTASQVSDWVEKASDSVTSTVSAAVPSRG